MVNNKLPFTLFNPPTPPPHPAPTHPTAPHPTPPAVIPKENNFQQPGQRYRSWDTARQDRFVQRVADILNDPRCTQVGLYRRHQAGGVFLVGEAGKPSGCAMRVGQHHAPLLP